MPGSVWWWWLLSCFLKTKPPDMWCDDISSGSQSYHGRSGCHNMCARRSLLHCLLYPLDLSRSLSRSLGPVSHTLLNLAVRTLIYAWLIVIELWKLMTRQFASSSKLKYALQIVPWASTKVDVDQNQIWFYLSNFIGCKLYWKQSYDMLIHIYGL